MNKNIWLPSSSLKRGYLKKAYADVVQRFTKLQHDFSAFFKIFIRINIITDMFLSFFSLCDLLRFVNKIVQ